jgi:hypothetical protein
MHIIYLFECSSNLYKLYYAMNIIFNLLYLVLYFKRSVFIVCVEIYILFYCMSPLYFTSPVIQWWTSGLPPDLPLDWQKIENWLFLNVRNIEYSCAAGGRMGSQK